MSIVIYRNPDGSVGARNPDTGDLMVAPTQEEFEACCCECEPCLDARGIQPNALITIVGDCDQECKDLAGSYPWGFWEWYEGYEGEMCVWQWSRIRGESWDRLSLWAYNPVAEGGFNWATLWSDDMGHGFEEAPYNVDLKCVGGKLIGSFDIPNQTGCEGCHAHVVLGG